ncbi:MAG: FKBP-type peptidyl-prolyl cis-trans isomerase [Sporichthyaceae bacterium]|nr:FKBP-type peptidyl-prolyl cis-trans isomerase [Sporichthyaceae bacterium]
MRRLAALLITAALAMAGCGDSDNGTLPEVSGKFGEQPRITAPGGSPSGGFQAKVLESGDGRKISSGDLLVVEYVGQTWRENKVFDSSWGRGPVTFQIGVQPLIAGWVKGLIGKKVGSRVLLVVPPEDGYGAPGQPDAGIRGDDTLVFVVDLLGGFSRDAAAAGAKQQLSDPGLPSVSGQPGSRPKIGVLTGTTPPADLISRPVVAGTGPEVRSGDLVVVQYVGVNWRDGQEFDSSWGHEVPVALRLTESEVIKGWVQGLAGSKVGSRVLLVIPPQLGYGRAGQPKAGIKPGDTLVFVVDILGAFPGSTA